MAIALILFCVFQVMTAVIHAAPPTLSSPSPLLVTTTSVPVSTDMADSEDKHEKRSLNRFPFAKKYVGTETKTLEILPNGTVRGVDVLKPEYGVVGFFTACLLTTIQPSLDEDARQYGKVSIKGEKSGLFICMNSTGDVYGSAECTEDCTFKEKPNGAYTLYYSLEHRGRRPTVNMLKAPKKKRKKKWYLAINKKTGEMLKGWKTRPNRKTAQFLLRPVEDPGYKETRYSSISTTKFPGLIDRNGSVSAEGNAEQDPERNPEQTSQKPKKRKKKCKKHRSRKCKRHKQIQNRNCDDDSDPFNLLRISSTHTPRCRNKKRKTTGAKKLKKTSQKTESLFSSSTKRRHWKGSTARPRRTKDVNLFSFTER